MSFHLTVSLAGCLAVLAVGCIENEEFESPIYDTCFDVEDCVPAAEICEELVIDFSGQLFSNAICTLFCEQEGPLSPDCPRAFIGRNGSCYPSDAAGGPDDSPVCFEPCDSSEDCLLGFRCLGAADLCGSDPNCPIVDGDRLCVPGPR
ncbi:MAG: hypothetical protein AAF500_18315 [Myxococcota bacterium]